MILETHLTYLGKEGELGRVVGKYRNELWAAKIQLMWHGGEGKCGWKFRGEEPGINEMTPLQLGPLTPPTGV